MHEKGARSFPDIPGWYVQVETYLPPFEEVTIDLIAVGAKSKEREYDPIIPPRGQVTGKLVFARPMFADIPLVPLRESAFSVHPARAKLADVGSEFMLSHLLLRRQNCSDCL